MFLEDFSENETSRQCQLVICYLVLINIVPLNTLTKVREGFKFLWVNWKQSSQSPDNCTSPVRTVRECLFHFVSGIGTKRPAPVRNYLASRWSLPM